jgi:hypothetical protein
MNVMVGGKQRVWVQAPGPLPQGVGRAWLAVENGMAVAGIFEVIGQTQFMLSYHVLGEGKPRVEKHYSFEQAQERATKVLSGSKCIPRSVQAMGFPKVQ